MAAVAVELAESAVRGAVVERRGSQLRLAACAEATWSGSAESLQAALAQLRKTLPIRQPVILGLPTTSAIVGSVQPLIVQPQRAGLAVQFELQQLLPYDVGQAIWHYQWRPGTAAFQQAVVAAAKRSVVDEYLQCCRRAGLAVQAVSVSVFGTVNLWHQQAGRTDAASGVLLRLDGSTAEWVVVNSTGLYSVSLRLPGDEGGGMTRGGSPSAGAPALHEAGFDALKASWDSVGELVGPGGPPAGGLPNQAGARATAMLDARPAVALIGPSSTELVERLKRELGCGVSPLPLPGGGGGGGGFACPPDRAAAAYGLAMQALGAARVSVNLLTEMEQARRRGLARIAARSLAALGLVMSFGLAGQGMLHGLRERRALLAGLAAQEQTYQKLRPEARTMLHRQARLENRLDQLQDVVLGRTLVIQAFEQAIEALPDEIWLTRIEFSKTEALYGLLEGRSRSFPGVTRFMNQLKSSVGWRTVKLLGTTVKTDPDSNAELIAFTIEVQQPLQALRPEKPDSASAKQDEE